MGNLPLQNSIRNSPTSSAIPSFRRHLSNSQNERNYGPGGRSIRVFHDSRPPLQLNRRDRERIFNLGYYTWVAVAALDWLKDDEAAEA